MVLGPQMLPDLTSSVKSGQDRNLIASPKGSGWPGGRLGRQSPETGESAHSWSKLEIGLDFTLCGIQKYTSAGVGRQFD